MNHKDLLNVIKDKRQHGEFIYPYYGDYSIAELEPSIRTLFNLETGRRTFPAEMIADKGREKVILFVLDGFGYQPLVTHGQGTHFFDALVNKGDLYPITSVFPSTTPAALTTIHTGFTPQEHGLPEWFTYFREFGKVIMPMQFRANWDEEQNYLLKEGGTADMLYERDSMYQTLDTGGVKSYVFIYYQYVPSVYGDAVQKGAEIVIYHDGDELMTKLGQIMALDEGKCFYHVYWGQIDKAGHHHGPSSPEYATAIKAFADMVQTKLLSTMSVETAQKSLLMLTADHGQIGIDAKDIVYLNDLPTAVQYFQTNDKGEPILPTGSPNDVFLFIKPEFREQVMEYLKNELQGIAEVITTEEAVHRGLYGLNLPTQRFLDRVGNVLLLPYPHKHIWYSESNERSYTQLGLHGGLSEEEMIVPLAIAPFDVLL